MLRTLIRGLRRAPGLATVVSLCASACGSSESSEAQIVDHDPNCGYETDSPFVVEGEPLTAAGLDELEQLSADAGLVWAGLDEAEQCALACVYMADELDHYLDGQSTVEEGCVLALEYEDSGPDEPLLVGSDVTCSGAFRFTVPCL